MPVGVRPGVEMLTADSASLVRGRRVGIVTNQASVDRSGLQAVDRLLRDGVNVTAILSPEHGFRGTAAPGEHVASSRDSATGLPIYSLYGATLSPTPEMLANVDVILVDLQDAGARYFTWLGTTVNVMQAAAQAGKSVVVLDRPNPIGGTVQGNILDTAFTTMVGRLAVPMRHGMTLGELALLAKHDLGLSADLRVVPVQGWRRDAYFDALGVPFIRPSPNLRDLEALFHYPGTCLFEGTALSVGRGTDSAYHWVGAPWLDTTRILARLQAYDVPGVRFSATQFTPRNPGDQKFADTLVAGIRFHLVDRKAYNPVLAAVTLLSVITEIHPDRIGFNIRHFDRLSGGPGLRAALLAGADPAHVVDTWRPALEAFRKRSRPYLLYN
jgi:uncharacterized protein YbbC (DUF1343 family)